MDSDKQKGPLYSISGLFVILAALGIVVINQNALKSSRPAVPDLREPIKVNARLWEDPYMAVVNHVKAFGQVSSTRSPACFSLASSSFRSHVIATKETDPLKIISRMKKGKVTVLGVMVSGKPFAEDAEKRTRYRYAVLSGLRRLGFMPDDPEHINYVSVSITPDLNPKADSLSHMMPCEWLRNSTGNDSVLLLWINDDLFRENNPLTSLDRLAEWIRYPSNSSCEKIFAFIIIGPAESGTLNKMLQEAFDHDKKFTALKSASIYSALATADHSQLLEGFGERKASEKEARQAIAAAFRRHQINFVRTVHTDRELAKMLVDELVRRNFDPRDANQRILLVSEWDTFYGRSLIKLFRRILIEREDFPDVESRVQYVSYLRGIDGYLPAQKEERKDEKTDKKSDIEASVGMREEATGKSQYDYLRRLSQDSYRMSREMKGSIKAVGVLGTDFYDKFLVLQAFHERFPQAVFFTTDLDARYLHTDALKWTRNLVVASNFDLTLRKDAARDLQGDVPPFRDNYQTSLYFATLSAFGSEAYGNPLSELLQQSDINELIRPQLFEIGSFSAVKLSPDAYDINPMRHHSDKVNKILLTSLFTILFLALLLFLISSRVHDFICRVILMHWVKCGVILALIAIGSLAFYHYVVVNPYEEPLSLFEGVSIWPTEILRLVAAIFAIGFIIRAQKKLRENSILIEKSFNLSHEGGKAAISYGAETWKQWFREMKSLCRKGENYTFHWKEKGCSLQGLWNEYMAHDRMGYRVLRLVPILPVYIVLALTIIFGFSEFPVPPVRGKISSLIDTTVLSITIISFTFLVFYVYDIIRNCRKFIISIMNRIIDVDRSRDILITTSGIENNSERDPEKDWQMIQLIATRTDAVGKLIFYPFIVLVMIFLSRLELFDNWQLPIGLAVVMTMSAFFAWSSAFLLRRSAEGARACTLHRLRLKLAACLFDGKPDKGRCDMIEFALKEIAEIQAGAFAPFMKHPLVQALFVPFGGVGGVYFVEFLTKMNL